ncbi:MAG: hypothetical protein KDA81_16135 [Planctomycetaceae bacterium]|nr:hypothetical protein [Planctomycetaceae bacterium]
MSSVISQPAPQIYADAALKKCGEYRVLSFRTVVVAGNHSTQTVAGGRRRRGFTIPGGQPSPVSALEETT